MNKESITMNYTKEVALSFLCQAMQDETIRLRKARKKERASIRAFLIEAFVVISTSDSDMLNPKKNKEERRKELEGIEFE